MLNVSRLLYSKALTQPNPYIVHRKRGAWVSGRFVETDPIPPLDMNGVIIPANEKEIMQVPEGDRSTAMMIFYADQEIFTTHTNDGLGYSGTSDEIEWRGDRYRVIKVNQRGDYGYYKAFGVYMEGD